MVCLNRGDYLPRVDVFDESLYADDIQSSSVVTSVETSDLFNQETVQLYSIEELESLNLKINDISISTSSSFYLETVQFQKDFLFQQKYMNENLVFLNTFMMFNTFLIFLLVIKTMIFRK